MKALHLLLVACACLLVAFSPVVEVCRSFRTVCWSCQRGKPVSSIACLVIFHVILQAQDTLASLQAQVDALATPAQLKEIEDKIIALELQISNQCKITPSAYEPALVEQDNRSHFEILSARVDAMITAVKRSVGIKKQCVKEQPAQTANQ